MVLLWIPLITMNLFPLDYIYNIYTIYVIYNYIIYNIHTCTHICYIDICNMYNVLYIIYSTHTCTHIYDICVIYYILYIIYDAIDNTHACTHAYTILFSLLPYCLFWSCWFGSIFFPLLTLTFFAICLVERQLHLSALSFPLTTHSSSLSFLKSHSAVFKVQL